MTHYMRFEDVDWHIVLKTFSDKELVDLIEVAEATLYSRHKDFNIFEVIR